MKTVITPFVACVPCRPQEKHAGSIEHHQETRQKRCTALVGRSSVFRRSNRSLRWMVRKSGDHQKKMVNYPIIWHGFIHVNGGFSQKSSINSMESDVFNSRPCRESPLDRRWRRSTANLQCTVAANATIFRVFFKRMKPLNDIVAVPKICPKLIKTALNYYINSSFWLDP